MVVPFAAGGTFDVVGRIIATRMAELLGQSVIVENVTGGGGIVGVTRVINAASDGYTLLFGTVGTHAYNQWIYKKAPLRRDQRLHASHVIFGTTDGARGAQGFAGQ